MQAFAIMLRCCLLLSLLTSPAISAETVNWANSKKSLGDAKYEIAAIAGGIAYLGAKEWNWGSSSFNFNSEGWFGMDTGSGGIDKLGHMYSSYLIAETIGYKLPQQNEADFAATYSALWSGGLMLSVELFDGFSSDHGFSYEDIVFNSAGIALSYFRTLNPRFKDLVDFRIDYLPSKGMKGFHPITDYSGMRYLLAVKAAGVPALKDTPFKYLELNLGYMAGGFKAEDQPHISQRSSELFVGISVNFDQAFFRPFGQQLGSAGKYLSTFFHYYQPRNSYAKMRLNQRKEPAI